MQWKLYLFGTPRLEANGQPVVITLRKALALLIYLAMTRQVYSRDALATLFWPEKSQQGARANLRRTLYDLNQFLDGNLVAIEAETVALQSDIDLWIDAVAFQKIANVHLSSAFETAAFDPDALASLVAAVDLYTDDFLAGFTLPDCPPFDEWQFFQRTELRSDQSQLLQRLIAIYNSQEKFNEALYYARRWLRHDPLEEIIHRQLMRLHAQVGEVTAALRQYDECVRILQEEMDVPPDEETTALYEAIRTRRFPSPDKKIRRQAEEETKRPENKVTFVTPASESETLSPAQPAATLHNLPTQTTPFIGRVQELSDLLRRLLDPHCRLLTLIGPGGIGKTRLSLAVAQQLLDICDRQSLSAGDRFGNSTSEENPISNLQSPRFTDGIFFVPLQPVSTPNGLIEAIAEASGFRFYSAVPPQQQLLNFLRQKQMLLVLDNFEHLLVDVSLISDLLRAAPQLKLLVTSRVALNLQEEWFHPIAGLALPPLNHKGHLTDAVQLFVQSAQRARPDFTAETEPDQVDRICRLVDGTPLALELAAAWVKVLSCQRIAEEIAHNLDILTTRYQNIPSRHRSVRAVLDQTWQLLSPDEQEALIRLPVFESGFSQEAAHEVAGASLLMLATLTEKALVRVMQEGAGHNRYQMHELLRQFVAEKLVTLSEENTALRVRHSNFYLHFLRRHAPQLGGEAQQTALYAIGVEIDNVRAAWQWAVDQQAMASLQEAVDPLYNFYQIRSRYLEGKDLFARAIAQMQSPAVTNEAVALLCLRLRTRCAAFSYFLCEYETADSQLQACLSLASSMAQPSEEAFVLNFLGQLAMWRGEKALAKHHLTQSLAISRTLGDQAGMASALEKLANLVNATLGEYAESKDLATQSLQLSRKLGRPDWIAYALDTLGFVTFALGEYAESEIYYRESLQLFEGIDDQYGLAMALGGLGLLSWAIGGKKLAAAHNYFQRSLLICRAIGHQGQVAGRLAGLARITIDEGDYQQAELLAREGMVIARELGSPVYLAHLLSCLGETAYRLGDPATARIYLLEALQLTSTNQLSAHLAIVLFHYAMLLLSESETNSPLALTKRTQAAELLTLVQTHPATWQMYKVRAGQRLVDLAMNSASALRTTRSFDEVVAELLGNAVLPMYKSGMAITESSTQVRQ